MPEPLKTIRDDLKSVVRGSVRFDEASRRLFATDASLFRVLPLGIVTPRDEDDLLALVRYASEHKISLTPRGGGTGLAGESLSSGLIVDLTQHFNSIIEIKGDTIRLQPGVVAQHVNQALLPYGRKLAIDSSSEAACTLGGMLATNASGTRVLKHGYIRQYVSSLDAVIGTGQRVRLQPHTTKSMATPTAEFQLAHELFRLIYHHGGLIESCKPKTPFNRCGYLLHDLIEDKKVALQKVMVGSEGTLGFITEATIRTVPLPQERAVLLVGFTTIKEAAEVVPFLLETHPSAVDLFDRRLVTMACDAEPLFKRWLSPSLQAVLLIEWECEVTSVVMALVESALAIIRRHAHPLMERLATVPEEAEQLWSIRHKALPALRAIAERTPVAFVEDIAVPVTVLASFLSHIQQLLAKHETSASILCHAGAGIVHLRPLYSLQNPDDVKRLLAFTEDVYSEVLILGGTISAQHGVGLARSPWINRQVGPLMELFQQVKTLFDPNAIYNPGKLVGELATPFQNLRSQPVTVEPPPEDRRDPQSRFPSLPMIEWELNWNRSSPLGAAEACHGCGACRTTSTTNRMCPIFHAGVTEAASPRAKANLLRDLLLNPHPQLTIGSDEVRHVADLCVNCKMCGIECPSKVAIPKLMLEAKAQNVKEQGLRWRDWVVAHLDTWARLGSKWAWLANFLMRQAGFRWPLEKVLGVTRRRRLPTLNHDVFHKRAKRYGWTTKPAETDRPRVLYFPDTFVQYFDPELGEATVRVLQAAGVQVYVPPEPMQSGSAALSVGNFAHAHRLAQRNINALEPLTREGFSILCSEPTTTLMLKHDYVDLLDDPGTHQVARHTVELMSYLQQLHDQGRLPITAKERLPLTLGHHVPCHIKALQQGIHSPSLLQSTAGLQVHTIDLSCSGMAGVYGLQQANFESSLRAGKPMLERFAQDDLQVGSSECSSCRIQMTHVGNKPVLHPVQWLALAYGLMPQLKQRLASTTRLPR